MERIATLIETPDLTWRDILYEVLTGMDPWDINISELATRYAQNVREMKEMNFKLPANVVLVSSVLLRMKSDILGGGEEDPYTELSESLNYLLDGDHPPLALYSPDEIDLELALKPKRFPQRRVTADELISAIQKALAERGYRKKRVLEKIDGGRVDAVIVPADLDIRVVVEETFQRVVELLGKKEVVLFSELARTRDEIIATFLSLLHLANTQKLFLSQERIFDEIYIRASRFPD